MKRRIGSTWLAAALAFVALATSALAQVRVPHPIVPTPIVGHSPVALPSMHPLPTMSIAPIALPSALLKKRYVGKVRPGTKVPLYRLPRLPMKTAFNTIVPGKGHRGGRYHPMAATGATILITAAGSCTTGGTVGDLFNVGCQLTIQGEYLDGWSSTDTYQDYVVPPNSVTATAVCSTYVGNADPGCTNSSTQLSQQGTYQFLVYDTTAKVFAGSVFVNAGQVFTIAVYQDAFHTEQAYQFDTSSSTAAYVYLQNVAPSDNYVVYVESTGVNSYCAYMTPAATPSPPTPRPTGAPGSLLCNPQNATGVQAPGGDLSLTWEFTSSLEAGSYSIVVYDQSANSGAGETLGQVQVSLTSGGAAILTHGATPAPNPSGGPNYANPPSETSLSWDSSTDASVGGISGITQQIVSPSTYRWSISDPNGMVLATSAPITITSNSTVGPETFLFSGLSIQPPGQYPSSTWVMQLYDTINKKVEASQAFQLLGYHIKTEVNNAGTYGSELNFPCLYYCGYSNVLTLGPGATYGIKFINDSNVAYGSAGDSVSEIEYSTGSTGTTGACGSYSLCITPSNTTGNGNMLRLAATACGGAFTCSGNKVTATDSNGNSWNVNDYCSATTAGGKASQCDLLLTPVNSGTTLPPGSSIEVDNIEFYYVEVYGRGNNGPCNLVPCASLTSELPSHGLTWSASDNVSSPTAWTPVFWGSQGSTSVAGTAVFNYVGASPSPTVSPGTTPWPAAHFYSNNFQRADYQNSTPWAPASARYDIANFQIVNNSSDAGGDISSGNGNPEIAVGFPSYIPSNQVLLDGHSTGWTTATCPASFGTQYVCFDGPVIGYGGGTNSNLYLDVPLPVSSFTYQEINVQAYSGKGSGCDCLWFTLTAAGSSATTPDGSYSVDGLGIGAYSLNDNLMSAAFTPNTIGSGQSPTPLTVVVTNTSSGADPNPDSLDAIVLEEQSSSNWTVNGTPTITASNGGTWSYLGSNVAPGHAGYYDYWFGVSGCSGQYNTANGPPQTRNISTPLTTQYNAMPACPSQSTSMLKAGQYVTINMNLNNFTASGSVPFYMYAHGANGGAWSAPKQFSVMVTSESASAGFYSVGSTCPGTAVATNSLPSITSAPNCYVYTAKNTSNSASIGTLDITLPAYDINGLAAGTGGTDAWTLVGSPITTNIKVGTISGGVFTTTGAPTGCAVNAGNTSNPTPGSTNGTIEISGCTGFSPGKTLAVEFQAYSPASQSDTYQFPSVIDKSGANVTTGPTWIGDQDVQVQFTIGLSVVVDPSNPGPGGSTPTVSCTQCAFSGTTIDFGQIGNSSSVLGSDVVRASVLYDGATQAGHTWQLSVATNVNPTYSGGGGELLTSDDSSASANKCSQTITYQTTSLTTVPTSGSLNLASGPEYQCSTTYDIIQNYKVQVGTETALGHISTITYTLVAN
jgi:hypothetical protein